MLALLPFALDGTAALLAPIRRRVSERRAVPGADGAARPLDAGALVAVAATGAMAVFGSVASRARTATCNAGWTKRHGR